MKKTQIKFAVLLAIISCALVARASISWTSIATPITPMVTTNIVPSPAIQVGTFYVAPPNLYVQTTNGSTNFFVTARLSFDNSNWFVVQQKYQAPGYPTNAPYVLTNTSFPVYGSITVSNGDGSVQGINVTSP